MSTLSPYYKDFAPPDAIAHLIGAFWRFSTPDSTMKSNDLIQHRVLPDGCMDIIFQYQRSPSGGICSPQLTVYGSTDRFELFNLKPATEVIGIRFHPGMAGQLLNLNASELFQQEIKAQDCAETFGKIFEQLCECNSPEQASRTMQIGLLKLQRLNGRDDIPSPTREALRLISSSQGRMSVSQIAETIGVNERTLRRGVTAAVGLPPKVLARILRFQNAVSRLRSLKSSNLCDIALACGYADQAHMAREFQQLAGLTPTASMSR